MLVYVSAELDLPLQERGHWCESQVYNCVWGKKRGLSLPFADLPNNPHQQTSQKKEYAISQCTLPL